ncbi:MAG TPA: hypothetical protein VJU61_09120 [Polyangiaceae bacterium]|nr:hypothetical protein [Polyangiaceae bacterium]
MASLDSRVVRLIWPRSFALTALGVLGASACWDFEPRCVAKAGCPESLPTLAVLPALGCGNAGQPCCDGADACRPGLSCESVSSGCVRCGGFEALPVLPGRRSAAVLALSRDGSMAVGWSESEGAVPAAVQWPAGTGEVVALGRFLEGADLLSSRAVATSGDGSIQVGWGTPFSGVSERALRWGTVLSTMSDGRAVGISDDGRLLVGTLLGSSYAFRWSEDTGLELLMPARGGTYLNVQAVSGDGNVVVGDGDNDQRERGAFRWTRGGGPVGLGTLGGGRLSFASSANHDGSVVVGASESAEGWQVFRWSTDAPSLQVVTPYAEADAPPLTDFTGTRVLGATDGAAFVWDAQTRELRRLAEVLGAWMPAGWVLQSATGSSEDGTVFVGNGTDPSGTARAWRGTVGPTCAIE